MDLCGILPSTQVCCFLHVDFIMIDKSESRKENAFYSTSLELLPWRQPSTANRSEVFLVYDVIAQIISLDFQSKQKIVKIFFFAF
jgi:hypothetical protein